MEIGPAGAFMSVLRAAVRPCAGDRAAGPGRAPAPAAREQLDVPLNTHVRKTGLAGHQVAGRLAAHTQPGRPSPAGAQHHRGRDTAL